ALVEQLKAVNDGVRVNRPLKGKGVELVMQIKEAQHVLARAMRRRQFQTLAHQLPGIGDRGLQRKPGFVVVPKIKGALAPQGGRTPRPPLALGRPKPPFIPPRPRTATHALPDVVLRFEQGAQSLPTDKFSDRVSDPLQARLDRPRLLEGNFER